MVPCPLQCGAMGVFDPVDCRGGAALYYALGNHGVLVSRLDATPCDGRLFSVDSAPRPNLTAPCDQWVYGSRPRRRGSPDVTAARGGDAWACTDDGNDRT